VIPSKRGSDFVRDVAGIPTKTSGSKVITKSADNEVSATTRLIRRDGRPETGSRDSTDGAQNKNAKEDTNKQKGRIIESSLQLLNFNQRAGKFKTKRAELGDKNNSAQITQNYT
jgi:hypothetical protein